MQKKSNFKPQKQQQVAQSSDWEKETKKQERNELLKKIVIWVAIGAVAFVGLALLVFLADRSGGGGPTAEPVVNENVRAVSASEDMIIGNPYAKVSVIKYSDFQCPACATYSPMMDQILNAYGDEVNVVYRNFPLSIHSNAKISAQAGYAAWKLGKFKEMKNELFNNQSAWSNLDNPEDEFVKYAESIGLDGEEFRELMVSDDAVAFVKKGEAESISLGLQATPTFFIGKKEVTTRSFEDFQRLIDEELGRTSADSTSGPSENQESTEPTLPPLQ